MSEIVCLGILVADVVARPVNQWPDEGKLVLVDQMELHTGGCAVNTGRALARLGIDTAVMGNVGKDAFGDFLISVLQGEGMNSDGVRRKDGVYTSATMVCVGENGERSFIHYLGANATLTAEDVDFGVLRGAKVLHIGSAFLVPALDGAPMAAVLKRAQEMGVLTSVDTAWDGRGRWLEVLAPVLPYADICVPSYEEARMITGESDPPAIARALMSAGVKTVASRWATRAATCARTMRSISFPRSRWTRWTPRGPAMPGWPASSPAW